MARAAWETAFVEGAHALGIAAPKALLSPLSHYLDLLLHFNERLGLMATAEPGEIAVKHFLDSLTCLPVLELHQPLAHRTLVDVGSGAGFPGIPLAIARPALNVTLLESSAKKCRFMQTVAEELGLTNISVVCSRAEAFGREESARESYDFAVSRAVAPLRVLAEYCLPLLKVSGVFLAMKGPRAEAEIEQARNAFKVLGGQLHSTRDLSLPGAAGERVLILVSKVASTPPRYPRRSGIPAKRPL